MKDKPVFLDTNMLVYAYDNSEPKKQEKCRALLKECFEGKTTLCLSNQTLAEFTSVITTKVQKPLDKNEIDGILEEIIETDNFFIINYSAKTVRKALSNKTPFWDSLIAETMKENNIYTIYTENTKDFSKIREIKAINMIR